MAGFEKRPAVATEPRPIPSKRRRVRLVFVIILPGFVSWFVDELYSEDETDQKRGDGQKFIVFRVVLQKLNEGMKILNRLRSISSIYFLYRWAVSHDLFQIESDRNRRPERRWKE